MNAKSLLIMVLAVVWGGCTFSPDLPGLGACESDGSCKVEGCVCMGDRVCVPEEKGADPVGCIPCETSADCGEAQAGPCFEMKCNPELGACEQIPLATGRACDDGLICTFEDTCDALGQCQGLPVDCSEYDGQCVTGMCDESDGTCYPQSAQMGDPCDDGSYCTVEDVCGAIGICAGVERDCSGLDDQCLQGVCDEFQQACETIPINEGQWCDDGDNCSMQDYCSAGDCIAGPVDVDSDTDGYFSADCPGGTDCNDGDGRVHPDALEGTYGHISCHDGVDNDCDGMIDHQESACDPICTSDGWCWENPLPQGWNLYGIHGTSDDDIWAVGEMGTILHRTGGAWRQMPSVTMTALNDVWAQSPGIAYVVGMFGVVQRYGGQSWQLESIVSQSHLWGVWGNGTDVWAVGNNGAIFNRESASWSNVSTAEANSWFDIGGQGTDLVVMAGSGGSAQHLYTGSWYNMYSPLSDDIWAVYGDPSGSLWLAGDNGALAQYSSDNWQTHSAGAAQWRGIWGQGLTDLWLVGLGGAVTHLQGGLVGIAYPFGEEVDVHDVWGSGPESVWALAGPMVAHYDGQEWSGAKDKRLAHIFDIFAVSDFDAWAVGCMPDDAGECLHAQILRRKHGSFEPEDGGSYTEQNRVLTSVHGIHSDDMWAVGSDGLVLHRDVNGWSLVQVNTTEDLWGVHVFSTTEVWAVGSGGTVLKLVNGNFVSALNGHSEDIVAIWGTSSSDVWVGGQWGLVKHWNGSNWSAPEFLGDALTVTALWGPDENTTYAATDQGSVFVFDGVALTEEIELPCVWLSDITGSGPGDIWAVGCQTQGADDGLCVESCVINAGENQGGWVPLNVPPSPSLMGVSLSPSGDVWLAGVRGTVLRKRAD